MSRKRRGEFFFWSIPLFGLKPRQREGSFKKRRVLPGEQGREL